MCLNVGINLIDFQDPGHPLSSFNGSWVSRWDLFETQLEEEFTRRLSGSDVMAQQALPDVFWHVDHRNAKGSPPVKLRRCHCTNQGVVLSPPKLGLKKRLQKDTS